MDILGGGFANIPQTREEFVASRLRDAILRGDLLPGERLDENGLADTLGVSRTPIRSALRILAAEGLIDLQAHRGAVVAELTPHELEEVYLVRSMLEGLLARFAAPNMDDQRIAALESLLEEIDRTQDPTRWLTLNNRFHTLIYQAANRPRILSIAEYVRNLSTPYILQFISSPDHMASSREDHRRILEACQDRDGVRAEAQVRKHLQDVSEANIEFVEHNNSMAEQTL